MIQTFDQTNYSSVITLKEFSSQYISSFHPFCCNWQIKYMLQRRWYRYVSGFPHLLHRKICSLF